MSKKFLIALGCFVGLGIVALICFTAGSTNQANYDYQHLAQAPSEPSQGSPPPVAQEAPVPAVQQRQATPEEQEAAAAYNRGHKLGSAVRETVEAAADMDDDKRPEGMTEGQAAVRNFIKGVRLGKAIVDTVQAADEIDQADSEPSVTMFVPDGWTQVASTRVLGPNDRRIGVIQKGESAIFVSAVKTDMNSMQTMRLYLRSVPKTTRITEGPEQDGPASSMVRLSMPNEGLVGISFTVATDGSAWNYVVAGAWHPSDAADREEDFKVVLRRMFGFE